MYTLNGYRLKGLIIFHPQPSAVTELLSISTLNPKLLVDIVANCLQIADDAQL